MSVADRVRANPVGAWTVAVVSVATFLLAGALAAPGLVWDRFIWHYFWGPVFADAHNARCAVMRSDGPQLLFDGTDCRSSVAQGATVAEPGYTVVSEIGYAITLVFLLVGVYYLVQHLEVGTDRELFYALVPFMLFGGALRVVEDASDAAALAGVDPAIGYPLNTLFISPLIYLTAFAVTLAALVATLTLDRRGVLDGYVQPMAAVGVLAVGAVVGYLIFLSGTTDYLGFFPAVTVVTLGGATVITGIVWYALERYAPGVTAGVGPIGAVVVWGHAVDGVANYLAADWTDALGLPVEYGAKHPVNRFVNDLVGNVAPASLQEVIGVAWGFLLLKIVAAVLVVYIFDERIFEESPRYALLLLVAILAVGLGPGTRDMLRATFGI